MKFVLAIAFILGSVQAQAFWVSEHRTITNAAIAQLRKCQLLPANWTSKLQTELLHANTDEDVNLARKWAVDSHFYNPTKKIQMRRHSSDETVTGLAAEIMKLTKTAPRSGLKTVYGKIGRITHYVQDAAVPAHVVPVNHFASDGFESFALLTPPTPVSCDDLKALTAGSPVVVLKDTASLTLDRLAQPFKYSENGRPQESNWDHSFWVQGVGPIFGAYGLWGDRFGQTAFVTKEGSAVNIDWQTYQDFKQAQVASATLATEKVLLWLSQRF